LTQIRKLRLSIVWLARAATVAAAQIGVRIREHHKPPVTVQRSVEKK